MITRKKHFLHVTFSTLFLKAEYQSAVEGILNRAGDWMRYGDNCWIVHSSLHPIVWVDRLQPILGNPGMAGMLVTEMGSYAGILPQEVWDWIHGPHSEIFEVE